MSLAQRTASLSEDSTPSLNTVSQVKVNCCLTLVDYAEELFDEAVFYEKFDQKITEFVNEVERKLSSVAKEREILSKIF